MVTGNMLVMFIVGFIIFCFYLFGLLYSIYWGHNSQREEMMNDPELRGYYNRHGLPELDVQDKEKDMIHRAPMTRKEMTEEDIKLREGRSKQQYTSSSIGSSFWILT